MLANAQSPSSTHEHTHTHKPYAQQNFQFYPHTQNQHKTTVKAIQLKSDLLQWSQKALDLKLLYKVTKFNKTNQCLSSGH